MNSLLPDSAKYDLTRQLQACQSRSRRNGKVARLPFALREQINRMIDDGLPYKVIIQKLGPAGQHLNEDNLSNWRLGGYKDYLKAHALNERARYQTEAAADVLREEGHINPVHLQNVCTEIALVHFMDTLIRHGEQIAQDSLKKNPAKLITLCNALCNMSNVGLQFDKLKLLSGKQPPSCPDAPLESKNLPNPSEPNRTPKI